MSQPLDPDRMQTIAQRDQLWASLHQLVPALDALAAGKWNDTDPERQLVRLLAGIVLAELQFRAEETR